MSNLASHHAQANLTQQVPATPRREIRSIPEELFAAHKRGEIDDRHYYVGTAVWVGENMSKYRPTAYPLITQSLRSYLSGRLSGSRDPNAQLGYELGSWVQEIIRVQQQNHADLSLLHWCQAHLKPEGLLTPMEKIDRGIAMFEANRFPTKDFKEATEVQVKDTLEFKFKKRSSGGLE